MNKLVVFLILNIFVSTFNMFSQTTGVGINSTGATANPKALLDIDAKGMSPKAGLLLPRMTTADRNNIQTPIPESLLIYNTDSHCFEAYYNGTWVAWGCLSFCGNVTDYDGNVYSAVTIGTQCWMQQNLKTTKFNDGSAIPYVTDNITWANLSTPGYCWYNNDYSTYGSAYGALYNWYAVNTGKLCPSGWHVPSYAECLLLTKFLGGDFVAGGTMKEADTTHWLSPNTGATNSSGFSALPGGYRSRGNGSFNILGYQTFFWSSSVVGIDAWYYYLSYDDPYVLRLNLEMPNGYSVRCMKN